MWDLSSSTKIKLMPPALEARSLTHWTTKDDPER